MARSVAVALLCAVVLVGCGYRRPVITRTLGGAPQPGVFVSPFSYEHFVRGELAYASADYARAVEAFGRARIGHEEDPLVTARLADCLDRIGRSAAADGLLDRHVETHPDAEIIWLTRGIIAERRGADAPAIRAYARASTVAPDSERAPLALAELLRRTGRSDEANDVLTRYLSRGRGAGAARARLALAVDRGDAQGAAEAVVQLLSLAPAREEEVRDTVESALAAGRPALARRLARALPAGPENRDLRLRSAIADGDRDAAEGLLSTWMPRDADEMVTAADAYLAIGASAPAIELARLALQSDGGVMARLTLGRALHAAGRWSEAALVLARIPPETQAWPAAPIELAATLRDAGLPALASEVLAGAHRRAPDPRLTDALASARTTIDDLSGALPLLDDGRPGTRLLRAHLLEQAGRDASEAYRSVSPDHPGLSERDRRRVLAERRLESGDREGALELLREWTQRAPEDTATALRLRQLRVRPPETSP